MNEVETTHRRLPTWAIWLAAGVALVAAFALAAGSASLPLWRSLTVSENVRDGFGLLGIVGIPYFATVGTLVGMAAWGIRTRVHAAPVRIGLIVLIVLVAVVTPWLILWGFDTELRELSGLAQYLTAGLLAPGSILMYETPIVAGAAYAAFGTRPTLMRTLGVVAVALCIGVFLYTTGWMLVGGETD